MKSPCLTVAALLAAAPLWCAAQDDPTAMPDPAAQIQQVEQSISDEIKTTDRSISDSFQRSVQQTGQQTDNAGSMETTINSSGHSHEETRSRSDAWSVSTGDDAASSWGQPSQMPTAAMTGRWTLAEDGGDTCSIELRDNSWFGGYSAYVPAGCPKDFFDVNRWVMAGNQLQLTDTSNRVIGRFRQAGPNRWSGRRESDGAKVYLNR